MSSTVLRRKAKNILWRVGNSEISPSIYDTAWACLIENTEGNEMFPGSLKWIQSVQLPDGSWGSYPEYVHDRVICTMAAIMALQRWNKKIGQIEKGLKYITENAHRLTDEEPTVAFEKILFVLQRKVSEFGLDIKLPEQIVEQYKSLSSKKIFLEPHPSLLDRAIMHSLELFAPDFLHDMHGFLKSQGWHKDIVGYSPAATAAMALALRGHPDQVGYIRALKGKMSDYTLPVVSDFDIFETCWAVLNVHTSGVLRGSERPLLGRLKMLKRAWSDQDGVGWAGTMGVKDLDDTAITYFLLRQYGDEPNERVFEHFEAEDHFKCFPDESTASVSHQAHLLLASSQFKDKGWAKHVQDKIISFLEKAPRDENGLWRDKWNVSEVYATSRVLMAVNSLNLFSVFQNEQSSIQDFVRSSILNTEELGYVSMVGIYKCIFKERSVDGWMEKVVYRPHSISDSFELIAEASLYIAQDSVATGLSPKKRSYRVRKLLEAMGDRVEKGSMLALTEVIEWLFDVDDLLDNPTFSLDEKKMLVADILLIESGSSSYALRLGSLVRSIEFCPEESREHFLVSVEKTLSGMILEASNENVTVAEYKKHAQFSIGGPVFLSYYWAYLGNEYYDEVGDLASAFGSMVRVANDIFSFEKESREGVKNICSFDGINPQQLLKEAKSDFSTALLGVKSLDIHYFKMVERLSDLVMAIYASGEDYDGARGAKVVMPAEQSQ